MAIFSSGRVVHSCDVDFLWLTDASHIGGPQLFTFILYLELLVRELLVLSDLELLVLSASRTSNYLCF